MKIAIGTIVGIIALAAFPFLVLFLMVTANDFNWIFMGVLVVFCTFFIFIPIYYSKTKIILSDAQIICKRPDKIIKTPWDEITKVVKTWTIFAGGFNYIVFTKNQGTFGVSDNFIDYKEIIESIISKTGLQIKTGL
ncbi:hypothetical protein ACFL0T_05910 [Candidatus Omnitrophota bacterium]